MTDWSQLSISLEKLRAANRELSKAYPGEMGGRRPVHALYGGAHEFHHDSAVKSGQIALAALAQHAPTAEVFAAVVGLPAELSQLVYQRVQDKLAKEPVEDFHIDFEDGYGVRPDAEEDAEAKRCALEVVRAVKEKTLPRFLGIRTKPLTNEHCERALRTLAIFVGTLLDQGQLPKHFAVTLPKVSLVEQIALLVEALGLIEQDHGLQPGTLKFEFMVETTQAIADRHGQLTLPSLVAATAGRCVGVHLGTYDYTAACGITAAHQHLRHPACDFAKQVMTVTLAGTGIPLCDGSTNQLPVGDTAAVHRAWRQHFGDVQHSLKNGYYQGWDLHPAQLVTRYAAVYAFFQESMAPAAARLKNFVERTSRANVVGEVVDDAATMQALLNFFLRGVGSGAISEDEALKAGLRPEQLAPLS